MHPGPVFAAPFHTPGDDGKAGYSYSRSHNPTWTELERAIASMETGDATDLEASAVVFASGMAAVAAVFGAVLRPGDVVLAPSNSYYTARMLLRDYFTEMGVEVRQLEPGAGLTAQLEGVRLLWLETPSNPTMDVYDIAAMSEAAHAAGALVAVDNTTPTPMGQRPLALRADFSVSSDTKALTGHGDVLLGHVAVRDEDLLKKIDQWRTLTGGIVGPMEAWLALRSIVTLPLRLERSSENALAIAEFLSTRDEVKCVLYPGLKTHAGYEVARRQMTYFGPVLGFELRDKAAAETFLKSAKLVTDATSFGGVTTTAERRAKWGGDAIGEGFIRMSAGCEAVEDLIEDIGLALDAVARAVDSPPRVMVTAR
jgi:cystathionine gamma-lyase